MILSLCTGYAGLDMAVEAATGLPVCAVADIDKGAKAILSHRFPDVPNLGDLTKTDFTPWRGVATVLTAGYPCQPFSGAGNRKGTNDPRHIFPHVARAIGEMGPRLVVLENVRGHLTLGFDTVLGTLSDLGYDARWAVVRASDVGAPHQRERLFIVAAPADADVQRHGGGQDPREVGRLGGVDEGQARQRQRPRPVAGTGGDTPAADTGSAGGLQGHQPAGQRTEGPHRSGVAHQRGGGHRSWGHYAPAIERWERVTRPAPAPQDRGRLSSAFVEWMMGVPEGWVTDVPGLSRNKHLHALGNGVVPQQALHALRLLDVAA